MLSNDNIKKDKVRNTKYVSCIEIVQNQASQNWTNTANNAVGH